MRAIRIALLALNGLRRAPLRVTLTTLGVTFASGAFVTMIALALGVQRQMETPFRALGLLSNIQVKPAEPNGPKKPPALTNKAIEQFEKLPGVEVAYPDSHVKNITIRYAGKETTAIGLAMPREASLVNMADEILVAGGFFDESDQPQAILGVQPVGTLGFSKRADAIGKKVTIEAAGQGSEGGSRPQAAYGDGCRRLFGPVGHAPGRPAGHHFARRADEADSGHLSRVGSVHRLCQRYRAGPRSGLPERRSHANRRHGLPGPERSSKLENMRRFFLAIQLLLTAVGSIALGIAALGIVNTLLMAVLERYQEIGLCKAIGASDGDLFVLFLTEAGIIGLLGGLTGIALGWLMSCGMEAVAAGYARQQGITGRLDLFAFPIWLLMATMGFSIVVSVVAGIYPALRAAWVDPIRALTLALDLFKCRRPNQGPACPCRGPSEVLFSLLGDLLDNGPNIVSRGFPTYLYGLAVHGRF